ncbi:hypothetical protein [Aliivibrio fischeri]|uniref:Uncharacterized protein n=1 Tax=Aliivibrio fischeri TaxID=668 RepID=A0A844P6Y6_ALIFS|nr:hypothetical protein [Aliivibrio fischeri]MUK51100.1 hypothetical protein [Aliivibrio fischeri]
MKHVKTNISDIKQFAASVYANGKKPCEQFGMTWASLSQLEKNNPKLTCRLEAQNNCGKVA